ncbi:MAG: Unknown protein [uncultured Sulfurovum sp.]|uniref:Uncharacterized protein n=1 Tax=uncultured Sulfurovum sp. TaxID=269237 RepID=A0A6S6TIB1_9BACT|nr:MAG: Unknown protein [uncultured Sulfurovum sp.]
MTNTHSTLFIKFIMLLTLTFGIVYAKNTISPNNEASQISYETMSKSQLQLEVERLSIEDKLPFEMGLELIKRWQTEQQIVH